MAADRATANVDVILLGMARGSAPQALIDQYGKTEWNAAVLVAAAETGLVPDTQLFEALAHEDTQDGVLARALILRGAQAVERGEDPHRSAALWLDTIRRLGRHFDTQQAEDSWLHVGQAASRRAREDIPGLDRSWSQVDVADHLLANLEPFVGLAARLREWACSGACALPNTLRTFRRGQLKWEAAKVRGSREVIENTTKEL